jgi:hypothetical protein
VWALPGEPANSTPVKRDIEGTTPPTPTTRSSVYKEPISRNFEQIFCEVMNNALEAFRAPHPPSPPIVQDDERDRSFAVKMVRYAN